MPYHIEFSKNAEREFLKISGKIRISIGRKIDSLTANPRPPGHKKLTGLDGLYRIRIGDYRVVYRIQDKQLIVLVVKIGHRKDVYDKL